MNPVEYAVLHRVENIHWWYKALHKLLENLVDKFLKESQIRKVLDIGCGTGRWGALLKSKGLEVHGIDLSPLAVSFSRERDLNGLCHCSANDICFADNSFDLITCINILESDHIDLFKVISECHRLLKPNGSCLALSPAYPFLFSEHDRAVHGIMRFSRKQMSASFKQKDFQVVSANYFFSFLFPATACYKLLHPPKSNQPRSQAHSDLLIPPFPLNGLLSAICSAECRLHYKFQLPFGTSVYVIAKKKS